MFGLIGKMTAKEGQRDALIDLVLQGSDSLKGCISYVVAKDAENENDLWITEIWDNANSHKASLSHPVIRAAIEKALPLIDMEADSFRQQTEPVAGRGLA